MTIKRCNFYDHVGTPRRAFDGTLGCKKYLMGQCRFIHPDEDGWEKAVPTGPPPLSFLYDNEPISPPSRRRSSDRHNLESSLNDEYGPPKAPRGLRRRSSSNRESSPRGDSMSHPRRSRSPSDRPSRDPGPSWLPIGPNKTQSSSRPDDKPLEPLVAPPPLPQPPSIATGEKSTTVSTPNQEPPTTSKKEIWLERIKLIADYETHYKEHVKLENELRIKRRLAQRPRFVALSGDDQSYITTDDTKLEKQREDKKAEMYTTLAKLMETNFWPVLNPPDMHGAEQKYRDLKKVVTDLKDVVTEVNGDLQLIVADRNLGKASGELSNQAIIDVDRRPAKRRRVDEDEEMGVFQDSGQGFTVEEFNRIRDRLENLEGRLSDVSNDLTQRDADITAEIESAIEAKWADAGPPAVSIEEGSVVEDSATLQQIESNLNGTGVDVSTLAEEVGNLMMREQKVAAEIQQLHEENAKMRNNCAACATSLQQMREQLERDKKAAEALSAALAVQIANPPQPAPSPTALPQEYILQILDEPIQDSVRAHIKHLLNRLRADVENTMRTKNEELYGTLWGRLTLTLKMVDTIARKVNQESGEVVS